MSRRSFQSVESARASAALLMLVTAASAAPRASEPLPAGPPVAGTIVLLGEDFELPGDVCRELLATARGGERVWLRPLPSDSPTSSENAAVVDPLAAAGTVPGQAVEPLAIDPSAPRAGDDAALCERTRRAGCVVLSGGAYLDWYALFTPREKHSGLCAALFDAHRSGALLIASGAAASFLGDWAIVDRAALKRLRRNPRDPSLHTLVRGLGLVPDTILDASGAPQAGLLRLLTLAAHGPSQRALYLDGPVAWIGGQGDPRASAIRGSGAVVVFDLHAARWQDRSLRGGRLSLLGDGDRWDERDRAVPTATRGLDQGAPAVKIARSLTSPLDAAALRGALAHDFSPARRTAATLTTPGLEILLQADSASGFGVRDREKPPTCAGIAFELHWSGPFGS